MSDREFAEGCLAEIARLENKRKPEPDRAGAAGREPDVLERLGDDLLSLKLLLKDDGLPRVSRVDLGKFSKDVADAIAEIKRLRGELMALVHCGFCGETWTEEHRWCDPELARLRAITEAEPVRWESRNIKKGHPWTESNETLNAVREKLPDYETRALAVVAPKGETT